MTTSIIVIRGAAHDDVVIAAALAVFGKAVLATGAYAHGSAEISHPSAVGTSRYCIHNACLILSRQVGKL
ncbi:hypothetical protein N9H39_03940 [Gammaproteobacteria bacterium]|nr:hypothetical protein [Gammaproteobacteria bacterium]